MIGPRRRWHGDEVAATNTTPTAADEWRAAATRVRELLADRPPADLETRVPACPGWTVRDLIAHVVGLDHDVLAGAEPDDHDEAWTQSHVDNRAGASLAEVLDEWEADAPGLEAYLRDVDTRPLNDVIIHEQDLRGALAAPGARESGGIRLVRETLARRLAGYLPPHAAPVRLQAPEWSWSSGAGQPGVVLQAPAFDLFRAVTSRRTAEQLRSYVEAGDLAPYLDAFSGLGPLPERSLPE